MFRVQLTANTTNKNPVASKLLLVNNYEALVKQSSSKFKIPLNKLRLFVAKQTIDSPLGTEITNNEDFLKYICDDVMIAVSNGENFKRKIVKKKELSHEVLQKISMPPRYPYPTIQLDSKIIANSLHEKNDSEPLPSWFSNKDTNFDKVLNGSFPVLDGNVCNLVMKTVSKYDKIVVSHFNGYISFDYDDNMTFSEIDSWDDALIRECRGLIISTSSGKVIARRFHKFFNIDEKDESVLLKIDFEDAKIFEKYDGSLVSPIMLDNSTMIWATRRIRTHEVEDYIKSSHYDYIGFSEKMLLKNITPLYEWCHDSHAVGVLCYPEKQLILLALRDNVTGKYYDIPDDVIIPCVKPIPYENIYAEIESVKNKKNYEGIVIRTKNENLYKLKSKWYVEMMNAQSFGQKMFLPKFLEHQKTLKYVPKDKLIISTIINNDDSIALSMSMIDPIEAAEFRKFINVVQQNINTLASQLKEWAFSNYKITLDKDSIILLGESAGWPHFIISNILDGKQVTDDLRSFIIELLKNQKMDIVKELLDVDWNLDSAKMETNEIELDIITFHKCSDAIKEHILTKYLTKKFSVIMGTKGINHDTVINFPRSYDPNEGKIMGMWEQFTRENIHDLRIDIQPKRKEYSSHYGNEEYVLILVQYGLPGNNKAYPYGEFAGILIPTDCDFTFRDIVNALEKSFNTLHIIKMRRKPKILTNYKVFCDLDGVLVDFRKGVFDVTGRDIDNQTTSKMWQRVLTYPKFFESLSFTPYGEELWKNILKISEQTPTILTGTPSSTKKTHAIEKKNWCAKHLGSDVEVITCNSSEKYKYASNGKILIDDRLEMGKQWTAYGGTFIHHTNAERTIYELRKLFNKIEKEEYESVETADLELYKGSQKINYIVDKWIDFKDKTIAIDSEWSPDGLTSSISIVQIGTINDTFIIDLMKCGDVVKERLYSILTDDTILKICFGIDNSECFRIGSDILNVIDLQEIAKDTISLFSSGNAPSLGTVTSVILGKKLNKSKEYQAGDWNMRPLSDEQLLYASNDVSVLIELYSIMKHIPPKNIYLEKSQTVKRVKNDFDPLIPVKILYSGIFLTPSSKSQLLSLFHPSHKIIYADHVTLKYLPSELELRGLKIGETVSIELIGYYEDDKIQAVECLYNDESYHVTISTAPCVNPKESINIKIWNKINNLSLYGIVGVMVQQENDELNSLPEKIKDKIKEFIHSAKHGDVLKFKPNDLSASERSMVHEYAKNNYMTSESTGKDSDRRLSITFNKKTASSINESDNKPRTRVTDAFQYSVMNIISNDTHIVSHGLIDSDGLKNISQKLGAILKSERKIIILRGLSGCGKSSLSKILSDKICSADDYFTENDGTYNFDKEKLGMAHQYCYELCKKYIGEKCELIVIDNTNSTLSEYKKYIDLASQHEYVPIVLEIYCANRTQAIKFLSSAKHNVSKNDTLKVLSRWETDDNAFLIIPYDNSTIDPEEESFNQWMSRMQFFHHNKMRTKTHMQMQIGSKPLSFIDVPKEMYNIFLEKYAKSGIHSDKYAEPKYLMEVPAPYSEFFKMYFDIDYISDDELKTDKIMELVKIVQKLIQNDVYVTYCISNEMTKVKTGIHFNCPKTIVTVSQALEIRNSYIKLLYEYDPEKNWFAIIDESVYSNSRGSRMFGSRKTTRGIDVGKMYKVLFAIDENCKQIDIPTDDVELLKLLSTQI